MKICVVRLEPTRFFNQFISVVFCFSRSLYFCVFFFYLKTSVYILKQLNEPFVEKEIVGCWVSSPDRQILSTEPSVSDNLELKPNNQLSLSQEVTFCCCKTVLLFVTIPVM